MANIATRHIEIRPNRDGQPRAFIEGTRIRVHDIYVLSQLQGKTPDAIASALAHLTLGQIHAALSYCFDHLDEIRDEFRQEDEFVERMRLQTGPGPLEEAPGE